MTKLFGFFVDGIYVWLQDDKNDNYNLDDFYDTF